MGFLIIEHPTEGVLTIDGTLGQMCERASSRAMRSFSYAEAVQTIEDYVAADIADECVVWRRTGDPGDWWEQVHEGTVMPHGAQ